MAAYAARTTVSAAKSRAEIEALLRKNKAAQVGVFNSDNEAAVVFHMRERRVMFRLKFKAPEPPKRRRVKASAQAAALEQAERQQWRALLLAIKAKLASVDAGIETFEDAFLAHIVMPDGETVGAMTRGAIADAYAGKPVRSLLQLEGPRA